MHGSDSALARVCSCPQMAAELDSPQNMSEVSPTLYRAGSGEPVVLLHGFTASWSVWRPILAELVARYEVIAPTLPGHHGGPSYPTDQPIAFERSTDAVERQLDELGVDSAHFVGNSMGGGIALELAKRGRARSVVALAPAGGWSQHDWRSRPDRLLGLAGDTAVRSRVARLPPCSSLPPRDTGGQGNHAPRLRARTDVGRHQARDEI